MKQFLILLITSSMLLFACKTSQENKAFENISKIENDTIRIANDKIEYEVIIIDPGFSSWFNGHAKPKNYYSQNYLESHNRIRISEWNRRAMLPLQYNPNLYEMTIDYQTNIDYGYDVNYMLYYYLVYFQITNKQQLGGYTPRI